MDGPCCKHDPLRPMLASAQTIKSAGTRHRPLEQRQRFISTMRALCAHTRKCCNRLRAVLGGNSVVSFFQRYLARNELNSDEHTPSESLSRGHISGVSRLPLPRSFCPRVTMAHPPCGTAQTNFAKARLAAPCSHRPPAPPVCRRLSPVLSPHVQNFCSLCLSVWTLQYGDLKVHRQFHCRLALPYR